MSECRAVCVTGAREHEAFTHSGGERNPARDGAMSRRRNGGMRTRQTRFSESLIDMGGAIVVYWARCADFGTVECRNKSLYCIDSEDLSFGP